MQDKIIYEYISFLHNIILNETKYSSRKEIYYDFLLSILKKGDY